MTQNESETLRQAYQHLLIIERDTKYHCQVIHTSITHPHASTHTLQLASAELDGFARALQSIINPTREAIAVRWMNLLTNPDGRRPQTAQERTARVADAFDAE